MAEASVRTWIQIQECDSNTCAFPSTSEGEEQSSGATLPEFKSYLCCFRVTLGKLLSFLDLSVCICKMRIIKTSS